MAETSADTPSETSAGDYETNLSSAALPGKSRFTLRHLLLLLVVLGLCLGVLFWRNSQQNKSEQEAKAAIAALNGLAVLDADQEHVVSLNLQLIKDEQAVRTAMQWVGKLPHLQILDVSNTSVADTDMAVVSSLKRLNSLHLNGTLVTDDCLRDIAPLSQLQGLHLAHTGVTSRSYGQIARLDNLIHLDLSATAVGPEIAQLAAMKNLKWLLLREVPLPPAVLTALDKFAGLKRLTVSGPQADSEQLEMLRKRLPKLTVD